MGERFSKFLDRVSDFLAARKGLLLLLGLLLVVINLVLQFVAGSSWLASTHLFLHLGVIVAIVGVMLAWAL